jgi:hypothetical protein
VQSGCYGTVSVRRGKEKLRARDPRAGGADGERRHEEAEEMLTGDEELRAAVNGAAVGFPIGGACRSEERVWARLLGGQQQGSSGRLYREKGGRGGDGRAIGHQCHGGRRQLQGNQVGGLNGEETGGEIKEGKTPGLNCTLDGGLKAKGVREWRGNSRWCAAVRSRGGSQGKGMMPTGGPGQSAREEGGEGGAVPRMA